MQALELKVPPPIVMLLTAFAMWGLARIAPTFTLPASTRISLAAAIALIGLGIAIAGVAEFRRARTTVNPMKPDESTALVAGGIFRITRNPMYVGLLFVLLAWAVFLSCAWTLAGPLAFVLYIGRFQIAPEERALSVLFGDDYAAYRQRVRRWL
jgi:protein-S-isoprenylcysteine O-methyltransferase Ste14